MGHIAVVHGRRCSRPRAADALPMADSPLPENRWVLKRRMRVLTHNLPLATSVRQVPVLKSIGLDTAVC
jgi:hypothetical protein